MGRREEVAREGVGRTEALQGRRNAAQRRADPKADGKSASTLVQGVQMQGEAATGRAEKEKDV